MQLRTEIEIEAAPEKVWSVLADFPRYHEWNPFIVSAKGELVQGQRSEVMLSLPESNREMRFRPDLLVVDPARELRWKGRLLVPGLFDGEHFFQLSETAPSRTRFVQGENFSGILVKYMGRTLTHTTRGFVYMNQALKRRVEGHPPAAPPAERERAGRAAR
jgi:hypothetical protein